jgi:hypothetical protein
MIRSVSVRWFVWRTRAQSGFCPLVIKKKEVRNLIAKRRINKRPLIR